MALRFSRLDRAGIRRLLPGQKLAEHGVVVERLTNGDLRYSVNVMVDGRRVHRVIGRESDGVTRSQCEGFIEKARTDARLDRLSLPKGRKLALTFAAAGDSYLSRLEQSAGKNVVIKNRQFRMYLKPFFGTMRLDAITSLPWIDIRRRGSTLEQRTLPSIASLRPSHTCFRWQSTGNGWTSGRAALRRSMRARAASLRSAMISPRH